MSVQQESKPLPEDGGPAQASGLRRLVRALGWTLWVLVAIVLGVLLLEGVMRGYVLVRYDGNQDVYNVWNSVYEAHPHSWYSLRPRGQFTVFGGKYALTTDSHGFRSPELSEPKAPNGFRIAFVGGSTTFNLLAPTNAETVPLQVRDILQSARADLEIEVLNAGTSGYTSMESLTTLVSRVLPQRPDLLVVYHGINDAVYRLRSDYRADYRRVPKPTRTRFDSFWYRHSLLFRFVTYKGIMRYEADREPVEVMRGYLSGHPPDPFARNIEAIVAVARANDIAVILTSFAYRPNPAVEDPERWEVVFEAVDQQNALVQEIAERSGADFLDLAARLPGDPTLYGSQVHRSVEGLKRHASILTEHILDSGLLPPEAPDRTE